jgi:hypothetical protein
MRSNEGDTVHSRHHTDGPRPNIVVRVLRGLVFLALLPAILVAGLILLPVVAIGRLVGLGPRGRGHGCRGRGGRPGDAGDTPDAPVAA